MRHIEALPAEKSNRHARSDLPDVLAEFGGEEGDLHIVGLRLIVAHDIRADTHVDRGERGYQGDHASDALFHDGGFPTHEGQRCEAVDLRALHG